MSLLQTCLLFLNSNKNLFFFKNHIQILAIIKIEIYITGIYVFSIILYKYNDWQ